MREMRSVSLMLATLLFTVGAAQAQQAPAAGQPRGNRGGAAAAQQGAPAAGAAGQAAAPRRVGRAGGQPNPLPYDLLLKNGHVVDTKNNIDKVTDLSLIHI